MDVRFESCVDAVEGYCRGYRSGVLNEWAMIDLMRQAVLCMSMISDIDDLVGNLASGDIVGDEDGEVCAVRAERVS